MLKETGNIQRAAGYVRVSQERTAQNGFGLQAQEADIRRHVDYRKWRVFDIYRENGVSGYRRKRPVLEQLLADAKCGKFDVVVFPSIDRVGRSVKDVIEIEAALRACGVGVIFVREGIDTSTPTGEFFRNIMASISQLEGKIIYERLSKGKRAKKSQGGYIGGWVPYGYRREKNELVVIPEEAAVVERIFRMKAKGVPPRRIAVQLNEEGIMTRKGGRWSYSTVWSFLRNRFYTGCVELEGEWIEGRHEAIVSDSLFEKCNS
jgi:DNA invertase Pin-like site-specific DNA recombinase